MAYQTVFARYEIKYLISREQQERIRQRMACYMEPDRYGGSTVRNIYFDTDSYRLIRHSLEKPSYKEKLRVRSYATATAESTVFAELKKKYRGVVYKRRISLREDEAMAWLCGRAPCPQTTQIASEIDYVLGFYGTLRPRVFLSYERQAYTSPSGDGFRVTFDENILCRTDELSLCEVPYGTALLDGDTVLMELKCGGGLPLWMVRVLSEEGIYKTSFSKYGNAYRTLIVPQLPSFYHKEAYYDMGNAVSGNI